MIHCPEAIKSPKYRCMCVESISGATRDPPTARATSPTTPLLSCTMVVQMYVSCIGHVFFLCIEVIFEAFVCVFVCLIVCFFYAPLLYHAFCSASTERHTIRKPWACRPATLPRIDRNEHDILWLGHGRPDLPVPFAPLYLLYTVPVMPP